MGEDAEYMCNIVGVKVRYVLLRVLRAGSHDISGRGATLAYFCDICREAFIEK